MAIETVRVGLIGAGLNTRDRHIPGFQQITGVEIAAVANRTAESGRRVADQFNIPRVYDNWQELLEDESLDAVCIGTWPYMHRTLTLAALEKGKHVLCEARMATNAQEAHDMLNASRAKPDLVARPTHRIIASYQMPMLRILYPLRSRLLRQCSGALASTKLGPNICTPTANISPRYPSFTSL